MNNNQVIRSSDGLTETSVQAWINFMALPQHLRCLQVSWLAQTKAQACVIWMFCERNRALNLIGGEECCIEISAKKIYHFFGQFFGCSERAVGQAMSQLIEVGVLSKRTHVDNVARVLWLNWPLLHQQLIEVVFPPEDVMMINFLVKTRAELAVLIHLTQATTVSESWFRTVSSRALSQTMSALKLNVSPRSIDRAIQRLCNDRITIMHGDTRPGAAKSLALDLGQLNERISAFYATDISKIWA